MYICIYIWYKIYKYTCIYINAHYTKDQAQTSVRSTARSDLRCRPHGHIHLVECSVLQVKFKLHRLRTMTHGPDMEAQSLCCWIHCSWNAKAMLRVALDAGGCIGCMVPASCQICWLFFINQASLASNSQSILDSWSTQDWVWCVALHVLHHHHLCSLAHPCRDNALQTRNEWVAPVAHGSSIVHLEHVHVLPFPQSGERIIYSSRIMAYYINIMFTTWYVTSDKSFKGPGMMLVPGHVAHLAVAGMGLI